jgi:pimeloyl-ACP methyl ester carboxylesterase
MRASGRILASFFLLLGACGSEDSGYSPLDSVFPARERPAGTLSWQPCGNIECATLDVPIDADNPALGTVSLALNRARANASIGYHGTVLVNPGGPGSAGKPFVAGSAEALRTFLPGFDFVGFDPRGIGESGGLDCGPLNGAFEAALEEGAAGYLREIEAFSRRCAERTGPLFDNMGSNQVVADVDRIRVALGEEEINFLGISYGTRLGGLYALMYPEHTRAVVLDAPPSAVPDMRRMTESQFVAVLERQQEFFEDCEAGVLECPPQAEAVFERLLEEDSLPPAVAFALANWRFLLGSSPGRDFAALSLRMYTGEVPVEMPAGMPAAAEVVPAINEAANWAVNCADDTSLPLSVAAGDELMEQYLERSPIFGLQGLGALTCSAWQVRPDPAPSLDFEPRVPPLVIGGTRDILTPYDLAQEVTQLMQGARLLTSEHYGHSALGLGLRSCIFGRVRRYLEALELPPEGTVCAAPEQ